MAVKIGKNEGQVVGPALSEIPGLLIGDVTQTAGRFFHLADGFAFYKAFTV
jgi:hypothetical protein